MIIRESSQPQVIVAQLGARRRYAVPVALHRSGLLAHFYTDLYVDKGSSLYFPAQVGRLMPEAWRPQILKKLLDRAGTDLPSNKVTAYNGLGLAYSWALRHCVNPLERFRTHKDYGFRFGQAILGNGVPEAEVLYALQGAALPLLKWAREKGTRSFFEQFSAPPLVEINLLQEERKRWPGWQDYNVEGRALLHLANELQHNEWQAADNIICPSPFVMAGLEQMGIAGEKLKLLPYCVDLPGVAPKKQPWDGSRPLRLLFVGGVTLGKGPQYFLQALEQLNSSFFSARLVGPLPLLPYARRLLAQRAELVGLVPYNEVWTHFAWADVFVFPSICEGSALVTYEALAAGLPVITTPNAGSVVRDEVDGFIVPIRDHVAIAERVTRLAQNPGLLGWMSQNAQARAQEYSLEKFSQRLTRLMKLKSQD